MRFAIASASILLLAGGVIADARIGETGILRINQCDKPVNILNLDNLDGYTVVKSGEAYFTSWAEMKLPKDKPTTWFDYLTTETPGPFMRNESFEKNLGDRGYMGFWFEASDSNKHVRFSADVFNCPTSGEAGQVPENCVLNNGYAFAMMDDGGFWDPCIEFSCPVQPSVNHSEPFKLECTRGWAEHCPTDVVLSNEPANVTIALCPTDDQLRFQQRLGEFVTEGPDADARRKIIGGLAEISYLYGDEAYGQMDAAAEWLATVVDAVEFWQYGVVAEAIDDLGRVIDNRTDPDRYRRFEVVMLNLQLTVDGIARYSKHGNGNETKVRGFSL